MDCTFVVVTAPFTHDNLDLICDQAADVIIDAPLCADHAITLHPGYEGTGFPAHLIIAGR